VAVLIDSSVWIELGRAKSSIVKHRFLKLLKSDEEICVATVIQVELAQGAKTKEEFDFIWEHIKGFRFLDVNEQIWRTSAWNYARCRRQGITSSTIDILVATLSSHYNAKLWTLDKTLRSVKRVVDLELFA
jgi:predicted nucleic acid-binding protein